MLVKHPPLISPASLVLMIFASGVSELICEAIFSYTTLCPLFAKASSTNII